MKLLLQYFLNGKSITGRMIIGFELSQMIECPVEKTFSFLSDFTNMPLWNYYVQSVTKMTEGPVAEGTVFEQKRPHDLLFYKIVAIARPYKIMAEVQPPAPHLDYGFELYDQGEQTRVVYKWNLDLENYKLLKYIPRGKFKDWLLSFAGRLVQKKTRPAVMQNFGKLKILLETGRVTLQDGRSVSV
ncbi:MAG: hypothetical protein Q8941_09915 [Bacteroidota bacterium]|nr:hypothetical protein [Bacteroidota bacterium]